MTEVEHQKLLHFKYKDIWKNCMEDLFYATHCHSCGFKITPHNSAYGSHCSKICFKRWSYYGDGSNCAFGKDCKKCKDETYKPTLANAAHIAYYYGLNPMGKGKKHSLYGIGVEKYYATYQN